MKYFMAKASVLLGVFAWLPAAAAEPQAALPSVYRFATPPPGFKPVEASASDLAKYGLPARPNPLARNPVPYATWAKAMSAARRYVVPEVRLTGRRHRATMEVSRKVSRLGGAATSLNWAGQAIVNNATSFGSQSFVEVLAQWVVSAVQQAIGTCNPVDVSAIWVGMDGFYNNDVAQAGTESDVYCSGGYESTDYYAWFEWAPADEYEISNFSVYPGAPIFIVVQATSATSATATFVNLQSNEYTSVGFTPPSGTSLVGNSAEWIVERPTLGNASAAASNLTDYGMIWMSSEVAFPYGDLNTNTYDVPGAPGPGHTSFTLTMVDTNNNPLAASAPQGSSAQDVDNLGTAK